MKRFIKNFDQTTVDFNDLFKLISIGDNDDGRSFVQDNYPSKDQILRSTFCIQDLHKSKFFYPLIQKLSDAYRLENIRLDAHAFVSFMTGNAGPAHVDNYDVLLYNLHGETMYIVEEDKYLVDAGDVIHIKAGEVHQSIAMKPRKN